MEASPSRFGLNLFLQFVLATLLGWVGNTIRGPLGELLTGTGGLVYVSFSFGVLYGFFRLLGVKGGVAEQFYQNFPMGFMNIESGSSALRTPGTSAAIDSSPSGASTALDAGAAEARTEWQETSVVGKRSATTSFDWDDIFSVKYLRHLGLLLIISAAFSMLFRLEWNTTQKLIASLFVSVASIAGAEFFKHRHNPALAAGLFLPGFACFQFSLTLAYVLFVQGSADGISPELWLAVKLVVTIGFLPLLTRYAADFADPIFFVIAFISPIALVTYGGAAVGSGIGVLALFTFLLALSCVASGWAIARERVDVLLVSLLLVFILSAFLVSPGQLRMHSSEVFAFSLAFFVLNIVAGAMLHVGSDQRWGSLLSAHAVLTQLLAAMSAGTAQEFVPQLKGYTGITLVGMSLLTFGAHLLLRSRGVVSAYSEVLCQLAMAVSAIGLFLQVEGTWTAVAFLVYSCITLWLSIHFASKTTRIYAFLMLTVSVFKLYVTSSELFDSLSGSSAILIIGVVLMVLAARLERLKKAEAQQSPQ